MLDLKSKRLKKFQIIKDFGKSKISVNQNFRSSENLASQNQSKIDEK